MSKAWTNKIFDAPQKQPVTCLISWCCAPCTMYVIRQRLLRLTGEKNSFCAWNSWSREKGALWEAYQAPARNEPASIKTGDYMADFDPMLCAEICCCGCCAFIGTRQFAKAALDIKEENDTDNFLGLCPCCHCCSNTQIHMELEPVEAARSGAAGAPAPQTMA
jgi:hypothetical protein